MPIFKKYNKDFFKNWSFDMAYVLGFLFADGNIVKTKRNTHFISFYSADKSLLDDIRNSLKSNHKISLRSAKSGQVYRLQIGSREMFEDLCRLDLTPGKVRRMKMPDIPERFVGEFIRGYFDGDGNVWRGIKRTHKYKPFPILQVSFTSASPVFLKGLLFSLQRLGIKGGSIYKIKNKNCGRLTLGTHDALKLYEIMYNIPRKPVLKRKRIVFEKFIKCSHSSIG